MKKLKLIMAAFALLLGWSSASAYTVDDLTSAGWTKVTTSLADVNSYYYVFVDAGAQATAMFRNNESDVRPFYNTLADPLNNLEEVWVIAQNGDNYTIKGNTESFFFNSGSAGWNDYVGHNNDNGNFSFTLNEGKYSIKATAFSGNNWVGPWNNDGAVSVTLPENIACNKAEAQAPGFFLYSISRTTFEGQLAEARATAAAGASEADPVDVTSYIVNPSFSSKNAQGWTRTGSAGNQQWGQSTMESWNATNVVVKQELRGVPNGKYKVQADLISGNNDNKVAYVFGTGTSKISSDPVSAVATKGDYTTMSNEVAGKTLTANNVVVTSNAITIGFDQSAGWIVADNFKLYYLGEDLSIYVDAYSDAVAAANAVDQSAPMLATALSALKSAISTYGTGVDTSSKDALITATTALSTATINATTSIEAYAPMASVITEIDGVLAAATSATAAADDYDAIKTAYTNGTIANDDIAGKMIEAYDAIIPVIKSQTNASADFTYAIRNHSFEYGDMTGWTANASSDTGVRETSNPTYAATGSDGKYLFNTWWKGNPITQTVENLPTGQYTLTASVSSDGATIYLIANGEHDNGTETGGTYPSNDTFQDASFTFLVKDGTATIGVVGGADGDAGVHKDYVEDGYWWYKADNIRLVKNRDLNAEETKAILAADIADAAAIVDAKANVGSNVFQIPESAWSTLSAAKNTAQGVYDDGDATANEVKQAIEDMNAAIEAYGNAELNAPAVGTHYNLVVATDGHAKNGNAVIIVPGTPSANNPTGYGLNANFAINSNLAQAITFTKVSGNTYNISFETADGTAYLTYGALNGSAAGWKNAQIQATTNAENKGEFKISATATANVFNIYNTLTNSTIACQTGGSLYTEAGNADFTIAEASEATVSMAIDADVKYATRIFPFTPSTWPNGVVAYSCAASVDGELTLVEVNAPEANVPYILYAESGSTGSISGWGTAAAASYTVGWLTGVYEDTKATAGTYVLQNNNEKVAFYVVEAEKEPTVGAYRCYLSVPAQEGRSAFFFPGSGEVVTGINAAVKALTSGKAQIFNASGAQIPALQKGMNIIILEDGTTQKIVVQ